MKETKMRWVALFDVLDSLLTGCAEVQYPVRCGLCGTKSRGVPLLFWYLPCERDPNHY